MNILSTFHSSSKKDKEVDELKTKTGRSYDCVFCQRGFTTAQALGGHMNIHRKDRASNKTIKAAATKTTLVVANGEEDDDDEEEDEEGHVATYFRDTSHQYYYSSSTNPSSTKPNYSAQFGDDWGGNLSLHAFTLPASDAASGFRQQEVEELDLELRLGHSTW